jgi:hypothetical protein
LTAFTTASTPGFVLGATAAFDVFAALAAFVLLTDGDDAVRGASERESGDAAVRRAARAGPEDVTWVLL